MNDIIHSGETALWRAVINQAFLDATYGMHNARTNHNKPRRPSSSLRTYARAARDWLLGKSNDFRMACDLAGLHPGAVRRSASVAIASADHNLNDCDNQLAQPTPQKKPKNRRFSEPKTGRGRGQRDAKPLKKWFLLAPQPMRES